MHGLQAIEKAYPYLQSVHLLLAKASAGTPNHELYLAKAATYAPSRKVLYDVIHHPETFKDFKLPVFVEKEITEQETIASVIPPHEKENFYIENKNTATEPENKTDSKDVFESVTNEPALEQTITEENLNTKEAVIDEIADLNSIEEEKEEVITTNIVDGDGNESGFVEIENDENEEIVAEYDTSLKEDDVENISEQIPNVVADEIDDLEVKNSEEDLDGDINEHDNEAEGDEIISLIPNLENPLISEFEPKKIELTEDKQEVEPLVDTEVSFDSIVEEKAHELAPETSITTLQEPVVENISEPLPETEMMIILDQKEDSEIVKETEIPVFESLASSDFLVFEEKTKEVLQITNSPEPEKIKFDFTSAIADTQSEERISKYNDEKLPYTFLWWLNKTRKEHAVNNQPYANFRLDTSENIKKNSGDELNHQIAENIFHLRTADELISQEEITQTVPFDLRKKEHQIIEKFITEEPQLKPPAPDKIDTENKAKKSSVDNDEVVSETLAKIYTDQMLYHKALDTYKKLSLKYPEKSSYFASQIKYLELKVN